MKKYWIVFFIFVPISAAADKLQLGGIKLFLQSVIGYSAEYCGSWWYVRPYIIMLLMFPMLDGIFAAWTNKRNMFAGLLCGIGVLGIIILCKCVIGGHYYMCVFITGYLAARYNVFEVINHAVKSNKVFIAVSVVLLIVCVYVRAYITPQDGNFGLFELTLTPLFICCIIVIFENTSLLQKPKRMFMILGRYSAYIWMTHEFYCYRFLPELIAMGKFSAIMYAEVIAVSLFSAMLLTKLEIKIGKGIQLINRRNKKCQK